MEKCEFRACFRSLFVVEYKCYIKFQYMAGTTMDYKKYGDTYYVRMDRTDEIISGILKVCKKENIQSAIFNGIGGCSEAQTQIFVPETCSFEKQTIHGMLELVSLTGNIVSDNQNELYHHTHAVISYKDGDQHLISAGHIKSLTVLYTAEIELRPVVGGLITRQFDPETGTGFWRFL